MDVRAGVDSYAALDQFLELIFADEDFFEDAFAAVVASWNACPPHMPPPIRPASLPPGHSSPPSRLCPLGQWSRASQGAAWQLRMARSPPDDQQS
jgi:hypothetical protein